MAKIETAKLSFNQTGTPYSEKFDDIYYSREDGLTESEYVFQQGNQLIERWHASTSEHFTIAETGFGTGLNFLAVCRQFETFKQHNPAHPLQRLIFISFEKYPLSQTQLIQALQQWPALKKWSEQLISAYPSLVTGPHQIQFQQNIQLQLWFGDVLSNAPSIHARDNGIVDAWFLDGFAPSKNPDMWQADLFKQISRLTKPKGTIATFTAAGFVRRGLIDVGFNMIKRKGFGRKREMIVGTMLNKPVIPSTKKQSDLTLLYPLQSSQNSQTVAVVGGGIAGICCAASLVERGYQVDLYTTEQLADQASGNRQGAVYPLMQLQHNLISELNIKAFEFSQRFYRHKQTQFDFAYQICGVLQLAFNPDRQRRLQQLIDQSLWPETLVHAASPEEATQIAGINLTDPAWYYPNGGWLNPASFIKGMVKQLQQTGLFTLHLNSPVEEITPNGQTWQFQVNQQLIESDILVLATGHQSESLVSHLNSQPLALQPVRGQVSHLVSQGKLADLKTVICHKGYLTPAWQTLHCAGASFIKDNTHTDISEQEDLKNLQQQQDFLAESEIDFINNPLPSSRAGIRAVSQDHLPIVGNLFDAEQIKQSHHDIWKGLAIKQPVPFLTNLYCLSGLGSRGLSTAPFLAEVLATIINDEPCPLDTASLAALNPNRFLLKKLIRREDC